RAQSTTSREVWLQRTRDLLITNLHWDQKKKRGSRTGILWTIAPTQRAEFGKSLRSKQIAPTQTSLIGNASRERKVTSPNRNRVRWEGVFVLTTRRGERLGGSHEEHADPVGAAAVGDRAAARRGGRERTHDRHRTARQHRDRRRQADRRPRVAVRRAD